MNHRYEKIARLAQSFLFNYTHASRKDTTEKLIPALHAATAPDKTSLSSLAELAAVTFEVIGMKWGELHDLNKHAITDLALKALAAGTSFEDALGNYWWEDADEEQGNGPVDPTKVCTCGSTSSMKTDHDKDCPVYRYRYV